MDTEFVITPIKQTLEALGRSPDEKWCVTSIAGLQFYDYDEAHDITGAPIRPTPGDRLDLIRQPENQKDSNAIEVRFRNGAYQLGHVPRSIASELAPKMDEGSPVVAFALTSGDGHRWSVEMLVVGPAVPDGIWKRAAQDKESALECEAERQLAEMLKPSSTQKCSLVEAEQENRRVRRLNQAIKTLWPLLGDTVPDRLKKKRHGLGVRKGHVFTRWKDVPETLKTKNGWLEFDRSIPSKEQPYATVRYYSRGWRTAKLYAYNQTKARTPRKSAPQIDDTAI